MKFLTIKKAHCAILLVVLVAICSIVGVCYTIRATGSPEAQHTIVIDTEHGGVDVKLGGMFLRLNNAPLFCIEKSISPDML